MYDLDFLLEMGDPLDIIEEAYKGKSKDLLQLEKMIGENRKKYYGKFKVGGGYYTDKDFIKIGDKIADIFGFKVCDFNLVNDPAPNAFTIPVGYSMTYRNAINRGIINKNDQPLKFSSKDLSIFIRATSGLWVNETFTDGEITAIIIHEVGHNFQQEVNSGMRGYMTAMYFIMLYQKIMMLLTPATLPAGLYNIVAGDSEYRGKVNKAIRDNNLGWLVNITGTMLGFYKMVIYEVLELIGRVTLGIPAGLISLSNLIVASANNPICLIVSMISSGINKSMENISDDFAAEHGYGPELISALAKFDLDPEASATAVERVCKKLPVFDSVCTLFALPSMLVAGLFSDHPVTGKRAANIVAELEKELEKDNVSPKMKKEIKNQIKEVKEVVDTYTKIDSPMEGTAMRKALLKFSANFDRDPKGFIQKAFSNKNLIESFSEFEDEEFLDSVAESVYFDLI